MLVPLESSSAVRVMIRSKSICNHSRARLVDSSRNRTYSGGTQIWCAHTDDSLNIGGQTIEIYTRWANSGKKTISKGGTLLWCPRCRGISSPSGTKLPHKKLETLGYHMMKTRSLSPGLEIVPGCDRQTDRISIASTRSQQYLPVQLWHIKNVRY